MPAQTPATPTTPPSAPPAPSDAATAAAPANLEQQVDALLAELGATQQKVEQAMQDPPTEAQVDLAVLEAAVQQAGAAQHPDESAAEHSADLDTTSEPDLELTDDLVTASDDAHRSDAGLEDIVDDLVNDSAPTQVEDATGEQLEAESSEAEPNDTEASDDPDQALLEEQLVDPSAEEGVTENDVAEALAEDLNDLLEDLPPQPSAGTVAGEQAAGFFETEAAEVDAAPAALAEESTQAAASTAQPASSASPKVAVPPTGAADALADLDRAIAQTATEMIKAEAPAAAAPVAPPVQPPVAATPKEPAPAAPAHVAPAPPKAKGVAAWLWTRVEPKLHEGVALLARPLNKKPARTRHALGLVGVYTFIIGAACWGWVMFLRPDTAASAAVEPFDFQKSGLPAPEHKEAHNDQAASAAEPKEAAGKGEAKAGAKDGKKKPLLNSGDGESVINKTMDDRAKKAKGAAKGAAKGGKAEAKKSGGH
jgi:hypothetical protein